MQRDKRLIAPFIFFTVGFIFLVLIPNLTQSDPNLATCYHGKVGSSNSLMQITDQNGVEVNGTLIFQNYEKDSSYGSFSGKYIDNKLTATFEFNSEGSQSVREITFTKEGKNLIGDGFTYQVIEECNSVLYNQGLGLIPFDMKLPLHLFPQMKLQQISDEQINWTFGPGGFKPIQSAKIQVKVVKTKTFQDPETGYYVLSQFNILGIKAEQSYRCDITAFDKDGKEIISWKTDGLSFTPNPSTIYSGQTNVRPDQVPMVKSSTVKCEVADAII